jgi:Tetratricopeptide repeat
MATPGVLRHFSAVLLVSMACSSASAAGFDDLIQEGVKSYNAGQYRDAQLTFTDLMNQGARKYGAMDARMGRIYSNLGESYSAQGNYYYGKAYLQRALVIKEKSFGKAGFELVPTLIDLGKIAVGERKFSIAEGFYRRALSIAQQSGQQGIAYIGIVETNIGAMYFREGKNSLAAPHFKKGLPIAEQLYGSDSDYTLNAVKMYSTCLKALGRSDDAKQAEELAVARAREAINPLAQWKKNIYAAQSAEDDGKHQEAERMYRAAVPWAEHVPDQMPLVVTLTRLAHVCLKEGKGVDALQYLKRAQPISEKQLGADDPQVMKHADELADLCRIQGRYDEAEPYYLQVLVYNKKQFGPDSLQTRDTLGKLGALYTSGGSFGNATKVLVKALAIDEKTYKGDDAKLVPVLVALADAYRGDLRFDDSATTYKRAVAILDEKPGNEAAAADLLQHFSLLYQQISSWDKAEVLLKRAVALREKAPGSDNAELIKSLEAYANMLRSASQRDRAEPVEQRIAALRSQATEAAKRTNLDKALE